MRPMRRTAANSRGLGTPNSQGRLQGSLCFILGDIAVFFAALQLVGLPAQASQSSMPRVFTTPPFILGLQVPSTVVPSISTQPVFAAEPSFLPPITQPSPAPTPGVGSSPLGKQQLQSIRLLMRPHPKDLLAESHPITATYADFYHKTLALGTLLLITTVGTFGPYLFGPTKKTKNYVPYLNSIASGALLAFATLQLLPDTLRLTADLPSLTLNDETEIPYPFGILLASCIVHFIIGRGVLPELFVQPEPKPIPVTPYPKFGDNAAPPSPLRLHLPNSPPRTRPRQPSGSRRHLAPPAADAVSAHLNVGHTGYSYSFGDNDAPEAVAHTSALASPLRFPRIQFERTKRILTGNSSVVQRHFYKKDRVAFFLFALTTAFRSLLEGTIVGMLDIPFKIWTATFALALLEWVKVFLFSSMCIRSNHGFGYRAILALGAPAGIVVGHSLQGRTVASFPCLTAEGVVWLINSAPKVAGGLSIIDRSAPTVSPFALNAPPSDPLL